MTQTAVSPVDTQVTDVPVPYQQESATSEHAKWIAIKIPRDMYFMSGVRDWVLSLIKNNTKFSERWAHRFQSIVDELCSNAIEHGSLENGHITLSLITHTDGAFEIIVEDDGKGEHSMSADDIMQLIKTRKEQLEKDPFSYQGMRGRGLPQIVCNWTDEFYFEDKPNGGLRAHAVKKCTKDAEKEQGAKIGIGEIKVTSNFRYQL